MAKNSIAGWIWLAGITGLIGWGATAGMKSSSAAKAELDAKAREQEKARLQKDMAAAIMLAEREEYGEAIKRLSELNEAYPDNPALMLNLAIALRADEKYDEALQALDRALKVAHDDWDVVAEKATVLLETKQTDAALTLADSIPPRRGHMTQRLRGDPAWLGLERSDRVNGLLAKHGIGVDGMAETGVHSLEEIERQRREYPEE